MLVEATNAGSTPHDTMNFTKFRTTSVGGSNGGSTDKTSTDADGIGMVRASAGTCSGSGSSAASRQRIAAVPGPAGTEAPAGPLVAAAAAAPQAGALVGFLRFRRPCSPSLWREAISGPAPPQADPPAAATLRSTSWTPWRPTAT